MDGENSLLFTYAIDQYMLLNDAVGELSQERAWPGQSGVVRTHLPGCPIPVEGRRWEGIGTLWRDSLVTSAMGFG